MLSYSYYIICDVKVFKMFNVLCGNLTNKYNSDKIRYIDSFYYITVQMEILTETSSFNYRNIVFVKLETFHVIGKQSHTYPLERYAIGITMS